MPRAVAPHPARALTRPSALKHYTAPSSSCRWEVSAGSAVVTFEPGSVRNMPPPVLTFVRQSLTGGTSTAGLVLTGQWRQAA